MWSILGVFDSMSPCGDHGAVVHIVIAAMGLVQTVMTAWLASRAVRKDRREQRSRVNGRY